MIGRLLARFRRPDPVLLRRNDGQPVRSNGRVIEFDTEATRAEFLRRYTGSLSRYYKGRGGGVPLAALDAFRIDAKPGRLIVRSR